MTWLIGYSMVWFGMEPVHSMDSNNGCGRQPERIPPLKDASSIFRPKPAIPGAVSTVRYRYDTYAIQIPQSSIASHLSIKYDQSIWNHSQQPKHSGVDPSSIIMSEFISK